MTTMNSSTRYIPASPCHNKVSKSICTRVANGGTRPYPIVAPCCLCRLRMDIIDIWRDQYLGRYCQHINRLDTVRNLNTSHAALCDLVSWFDGSNIEHRNPHRAAFSCEYSDCLGELNYRKAPFSVAEILEHHSGFTSKKAPGLDAMCPRQDYRKDCQHYSVRWTVLIHQTVGAMACACQYGVVVPRIHSCSGGQRCDCKSKPSGRPRENVSDAAKLGRAGAVPSDPVASVPAWSPLFCSAERRVPVLVSKAAQVLQNEEFLRPSGASGSDGHAVYHLVCWMLVQTVLLLV